MNASRVRDCLVHRLAMTLDKFRPLDDRALGPFVSAAKVAGLSPNGVSVIAFLLALGAGGVYAVAAREPLCISVVPFSSS